jgi:hypothetical protein
MLCAYRAPSELRQSTAVSWRHSGQRYTDQEEHKTNGAPGILAGLDARDTHASMNRSTWGKARPEGKRLANSLISNLVPAKLFRANWRSANIGGQQDLQPWPATTKLTGHNSPW